MASSLANHVKAMSQYHKWACVRLNESVSLLTDGQYRADSKLFFRSVHGTLNHMLLAERLWMARLTDQDYSEIAAYWGEEQGSAKWEGYIQSRHQLHKEMTTQCDKWIEYANGLSDDEILETFSYLDSSGAALTGERAPILLHIFNHGTHHRGQITTALTQNGLPGPALDYLYFFQPHAG